MNSRTMKCTQFCRDQQKCDKLNKARLDSTTKKGKANPRKVKDKIGLFVYFLKGLCCVNLP
ncbi:unnamed protein product [Clavelina lepadiformis]|uniref:Uncharacterized protein n=1 Tax=Clavelina lepadiformis TaxID=159417 RepID=A0ABP0FUC8_CLALP